MDSIFLQLLANRIEGYCDLEMWEDAEKELAELGTKIDSTPEGRELRLRILMGTESWSQAANLAMELANEHPKKGHYFTHTAYCLHELGRTQEAREFLLSGPPTLRYEPLFYYNLACYECVLGDVDAARVLLRQACDRDDSLIALAKKDPDLAKVFS